MRKNSPRKWLHAVLDLLPVILIPVFMIYSHRHEINDGSIQVQEKQVLDVNQYVGSYGDFTYSQGLNVEANSSGYMHFTGQLTNGFVMSRTLNLAITPLIPQHYYYVYISYGNEPTTIYLRQDSYAGSITSNIIYKMGSNVNNFYFYFNDTSVYYDFSVVLNVTDLTKMFGVGNEPTTLQDLAYYDFSPCDYVISHKEIFDKPSLTIYNDTDIMSQFTYQLYNAVDKYFNMGNVFNLNGVYDWFNLNIFNGSAPIYIYVVWQIVLYEFVMDLLFLLYGLFMWFIDMVQHLMDKPFKSIK